MLERTFTLTGEDFEEVLMGLESRINSLLPLKPKRMVVDGCWDRAGEEHVFARIVLMDDIVSACLLYRRMVANCTYQKDTLDESKR